MTPPGIRYSAASLLDKDRVRDDVACPRCGAERGEPCRREGGRNHFERIKAARTKLYEDRRR